VNARPGSPRPHRGTVLIVILVLLALLSLLAVSLATTSALDKNVSFNYLDSVRARLVAKAGVEFAISKIEAMVQRGKFDDPAMTYWGLKTVERGEPDTATPITRALNPSYAIEDEDVQNPDDSQVTPAKFKLDDREVGISGTMSSCAHGLRSDVFRLRVADSNSRLYVNDGLEEGPSGLVSKNLRRILDILGNQVGVTELGRRLMEKRPTNGYQSRQQLRDLLGPSDFEKLAPHITLHAWVDHSVVNPVPLSAQTLGAYPVPYNDKISLYRYGRSFDAKGNKIDGDLVFAPEYALPNGFDHAIMALDEINAQWIERTARAPVNVNFATREVLTSLIAGLRGWFVSERRKYNPAATEYSVLEYPGGDNRPGGWIGDEYGFLYSTLTFVSSSDKETRSTPGAGGIEASLVADEIVACRNRSRSPHCPSLDYDTLWYGGPFRTWRQFNAFCDGLVKGGLLVDNRNIFYDYEPADASPQGGEYFIWGQRPQGSDNLVESSLQRSLGSQALADVLKANFNPNCTLNELNPDQNLHLLVDKTDLICNSTEFCFSPMGYFDIESEGVVTQPPQNGDFLVLRRGAVVARELVESVVRVYDVYRETSQADFIKGDLGAPLRRRLTNSNRPLETGPEPNLGPAPHECHWSGWIQLSTIGGIHGDYPPGSTPQTPEGSSEYGDVAHAHFQYDHRLHFHAGKQRDHLRFSRTLVNQKDRTEVEAGPYNPGMGSPGHYRLGRDWKRDQPPPAPQHTAVSDLRVDGTYVERDCACMYLNTAQVFATEGAIAFWVKPSFHPEMTGKARTFWSTDTMDMNTPPHPWQLINAVWFFPSHDAPPGQPSPNEFLTPSYWSGPWRPITIACGFATKGEYGGGAGQVSPSLNHRTHADTGTADLMKHHEWLHVVYAWNMNRQDEYDPLVPSRTWLALNGQILPSTGNIKIHPREASALDWTSEGAVFRLGEPSTTMMDPYYGAHRNWTADATIDEFYMWKGDSLERASNLFELGRYHLPRPGQEGIFTSQSFTEGLAKPRRLANPAEIRAPFHREPGEHNRTSVSNTSALRAPDDIRILGASWTWYPEKIDIKGKPMAHDHLANMDTEVEVKLVMVVADEEVGTYLADDGGSGAGNVGVTPGQKLQYRLKMQLKDPRPGMILLASPMIDDVTIFYSVGIHVIHFNREEIGQ